MTSLDTPIIRAYLPSVQEVLIENIADPVRFLRPRPSEEEINELANSLQATGLIQPIVVARLDSGFRLVAGYRRLLATQKLGLKTIPACVIEANECDEVMLGLAENLDRKDADPLRVAEAIYHLHVTSSLPLKELARRFNRSLAWLSNLLRVYKYSYLFKEAIETGDLQLQHCLEICGLDKVDSMAGAIRFARSVRPRVRELREYVRFLRRIDEIQEALRSCDSQEERGQLIKELQALNIQLAALEGAEKRSSGSDRSKEAFCDFCSNNVLRRHMSSIKLCPSCYLRAKEQLIKKHHSREK